MIGQGSKIWHDVQLRPRVRIGENCILGKGVYIDEDVIVGNNVKIQNRGSIYKYCTLEDGVFVGPHVCFTNDFYPRAINPDGTLKSADDWHAGRTLVRYGASIGAGAIILPGRTIGRFALIGAGAVVTRDVTDHGVVLGNPARLIGFACRCGRRLQPAGTDLVCPDCHDVYSFSGDVVVRVGEESGPAWGVGPIVAEAPARVEMRES
ncbi:MAG TPA: acyltransferase [Thermomicrobiaceae bacterium]|nr:acyltransferase [Thermomicrobiaceae bacterium]